MFMLHSYKASGMANVEKLRHEYNMDMAKVIHYNRILITTYAQNTNIIWYSSKRNSKIFGYQHSMMHCLCVFAVCK